MQIRALIIPLATLLATSPALAAEPSRSLDDYALLAADRLQIETIAVPGGGDVGVSEVRGALSADRIEAPLSVVVADRLLASPAPGETVAGFLFANRTWEELDATPFEPPLFQDLATACSFPRGTKPCDASRAITIDGGEITPGRYGELRVVRTRENLPATVLLAGDYQFCSVDVCEGCRVLFKDPSRVLIDENLKSRIDSWWGPACSGVAPLEIDVFVAGRRAHFYSGTYTGMDLCAPDTTLLLHGPKAAGRYVADRIRVRDLVLHSAD